LKKSWKMIVKENKYVQNNLNTPYRIAVVELIWIVRAKQGQVFEGLSLFENTKGGRIQSCLFFFAVQDDFTLWRWLMIFDTPAEPIF
jgi:hypothetical protein